MAKAPANRAAAFEVTSGLSKKGNANPNIEDLFHLRHLRETRRVIEAWRINYNQFRLHSGWNLLPPQI